MLSLFCPLIGFFLGFFLQKWPKISVKVVILFMLLSCIFSLSFWIRPITSCHFGTWMEGTKWGLYVDRTTTYLISMVLSISLLTHIYSLGYMKDDPRKASFIAQLSLFTFAMLFFLSSPHLLQLFMGWELLGLCSYLLIGFWSHKPSANKAALKAFIVNRIGDVGIVLGIGLFFWSTGSFYIPKSFHSVADIDAIAILLFIGVMAKSAQFGFHVWLPDAMEGPTPVSALIHAATMVTAGIILMIRLSPLFIMSPWAQKIILCIGALTAVFGALIGCTQYDIKRIIAYSTCSQLGFMVMSCGIGAHNLALFHLITHAFFKALLFLGAGSVIHAMSNEQNLQNMGGLYKRIPYTYAAMWIGCLSLMGIPFFSGYFSKEAILSQLGHSIYGYVGLLTALLTALYSSRLMYLVFHGECKASERVQDYLHEAPRIMLISMALLSLISLFLGWFLHPIFVPSSMHASSLPWILSIMVTGYVFYKKYSYDAPSFLKESFYIDELYHVSIIKPLQKLACFSSERGEYFLNTLGPNGVSFICKKASHYYKYMQTGYVFHYALWTGIALAILLLSAQAVLRS